MEKINQILIKGKIKAYEYKKKIMENKKNGDHQVIVAILLIAAAVVVCYEYKGFTSDLLTEGFKNIKGKVVALFNEIG